MASNRNSNGNGSGGGGPHHANDSPGERQPEGARNDSDAPSENGREPPRRHARRSRSHGRAATAKSHGLKTRKARAESGGARPQRARSHDSHGARHPAESRGAQQDHSGDHDDADAQAPRRPSQNGKGSRRRRAIFKSPAFKIGVAVALLALIAGGVVWWSIARHYEDTDDAFIDTHIVHVAPQVAGQVRSIAVDDNQDVKAGSALIEIDSAPAQAHLNQIRAQQAQAETQYRQALANAEAARAQVDNTSRDLVRYRQLQRTTPGAVAQAQIDQATAAARTAAAQRDAATQQIEGASAQINVAKAERAAAELNLGYAHIVAPVDGRITQRTVAVGDYVAPGQQLLDIVPRQVWVTANFKETQLGHMRVGQAVTVKIDSCGVKVPGHVDSIQSGAGQAFGLLPPENATGNFVKVVQRVPVKIVLDQIPDNCVLGPGMSVEPRVKVR